MDYTNLVWFEPTEVRKAKKIMEILPELRTAVHYISPNMLELFNITSMMPAYEHKSTTKEMLKKSFTLCFNLFPNLRLILLTQGKKGIMVSCVVQESFKQSISHVYFF